MLYKRGKTWWYKFKYNGAEIRESARTRNKNVAAEVERKRHHDLERGVMSVPKPQKTPLFAAAAREWLDAKQDLAPRTRTGYAHSVKTLSQRFGKRLVCEISARDIEKLQADRRAVGIGGARINFEVGVLRQILRRNRVWWLLSDDVQHLTVATDVGRQIPREHEQRLLDAVAASGSPALLPLFVLSIDTGLRAGEVSALRYQDVTLQWQGEVILGGHIVVPKSKTAAGKGRLVPLTQRACGVLTLGLARFPLAAPGDFLFPRHAVVMAPKSGAPVMRDIVPSEPMGGWGRAWRRALRISGLRYRWHDLRHTYISRLAESPTASEATIRSLAGHVSKRMLDRYSHIRNEAKVAAIAALEHGAVPVPAEGWVQNWAQSEPAEPSLPN